MRQKVLGFVSWVLLFSITISIVPTKALAAISPNDDFYYADYSEIPVNEVSNSNIRIKRENDREPRTLEELKNLDCVTTDSNGNVISVDTADEELTIDEINILFGSTTDIEITPAHISAGVSEQTYDTAVEYHGSEYALSKALNSLAYESEEYALSSEKVNDIKSLIFSGYTYHQAQAAVITAEKLNLSIESLCEAKIEELTSSISKNTSNEHIVLATKLGVPVEVIDSYMRNNLVTESAIISSFENNYTLINELSTENENILMTELDNLGTSSGNEYHPEIVLDKPYDYKNYGNLDINMSSGSFRYMETDLYLPGVNGLDIEFSRIYDSSFANIHTPYAIISDDEAYANTHILRVAVVGGEIVGSGGYISDLTGYTVAQQGVNNLIHSNGLLCTASEHEIALERYNSYREVFETTIYSATTPDGDSVSMVFYVAIEPTSNYASVVTNTTSSYNYLISENGLGHGWRLNLPALEQYAVDSENSSLWRAVLSDGSVYELTENSSNVTGLEDVLFNWSDSSYIGATMSLTYANGRKEYFNSDGRCVRIVDRFGNSINISYTVENNIVTKIQIVDTLGNNIVYKQDSLAAAGTLPETGQIYNIKHSLLLNNTTIRTYYSRSHTDSGMIELIAVKDELGQITVLSNEVKNKEFDCMTTSANTNMGTYAIASLYNIEYPNGLNYAINTSNSSVYESYSYCGFKERHTIQETYYYENNADKSDRYWFSIGDNTGFYYPLNATNTSYEARETRYNSLNGGSGKYSYYTEYTFNNEHEPEKEEIYIYESLSSAGTSSPDLVGRTSSISYQYNDYHLPTKKTVTVYEPETSSGGITSVYTYTYDSKGNVLTEILPNLSTATKTIYTYDPNYNIPLTTTYYQAADTVIVETNELTSNGKSIAKTTVTTNGITTGMTDYTYDSQGRVTTIKNYSSANEFTLQTLSYIDQNGDDCGQITQTQITGVKDADGNNAVQTPGYSAGTVVSRTIYNDRGWPVSDIDANGKTTNITYDATGRITQVTYSDSGKDQYVYNTANNTVTYTDPENNVTVYEYDTIGNLIEVYDNTSETALVTNEYDSCGQLILETIHSLDSTKDKKTYYNYDSLGRLIETGILNSDNTNTPLETYSYSLNSSVKKTKTTHTILGSTNTPSITKVSYSDVMGFTTEAGRVYNNVEYLDTYTYDYLGNCLVYDSAYTASIGEEFTNEYTYDRHGNVLTTKDTLNNTVINTYDWLGNLTHSQDAKGNVVQYIYDKLGRLVMTKTPIDSSRLHVSKNYYDAVGNTLKQMISKGTAVSNGLPSNYDSVLYTYDSMNRMTAVETVLNNTKSLYSTYEYNKNGNLLNVKSGYEKSGSAITGTPSITSYTYDQFGNVLTMTDPAGKSETSTYDINGNILSHRDRNNTLTSYVYNNRGRLTEETVGTIVRNYTYGLNGSLLGLSSGGDTISYVYDSLGRKVRESHGRFTKSYVYNIGDMRTSFTLLGSATDYRVASTYTYDELGRLDSVSGMRVNAEYTYDANGNPTTVSLGNGYSNNYTYNASNLVTNVTAGNYRYNYTYDLSGRQVSVSGTANAAYTYDGAGRLISESGSGGGSVAKSYTYDLRGNRISLSEGSRTTSYTYDISNKLNSSADSGVTTQYTYDDNGNTLSVQEGTNTATQYTYNALDQQTNITGDELTATYTYYPDGLRKTKSVNGITTTYVWDGDRLVLEYTGTMIYKYTYGLQLIGRAEMVSMAPGDYSLYGGGIDSSLGYYYHFDGHGNVIAMTDEEGYTTATYRYDAFGNEISSGGGSGGDEDTNPFRYCGEYLDFETGTYYLRARYYSPVVGRFTQMDDYWDASNYVDCLSNIGYIRQMENLYVYSIGDPISYQDPNGQFALSVGGAVLAKATPYIVTGVTIVISGSIKYYKEHSTNKSKKNWDKHTKKRPGEKSKAQKKKGWNDRSNKKRK